MANSFIGKPLKLISQSDVRYHGTLVSIDSATSTIKLANVYAMGTENRRPPEQYIPPVMEPYEFVVFKASEVKDISEDIPQQRPTVHVDPAIVASTAAREYVPPSSYAPYPQQQAYMGGVQAQPAPPQPQQRVTPNNASIHSAAASLDAVQGAIRDLHSAPRAPRRRGPSGNGNTRSAENASPASAAGINVPTTDFDFQGSNAKFDKVHQVDESAEDDKEDHPPPAYDPSSSFFDKLSGGGGGGSGPGGRGGRGRGRGRSRREEERERNVATFGEPGGVGMIGAGAYVRGWGEFGHNRSGRGNGVYPNGRGGYRGRRREQAALGGAQ
ncbi:hypothetical protein FISHEDRAFT_75631 [Fistulina hepatica ATCC 64428]|uniref:TFG box profile domain-containing protein n=1 Tax=Fistulina hepatica ATCC 64428 TaxID=1128425 RepID=A0A0D7A941_9AGAR|nr:hypothetical protein FISHEDRAFT_75631 [Fistulina hepatica ATCC 64428]